MSDDAKLTRRMSAEDAWFLYFEKPDAPLHIGSVGIFEGTVPFDDIYQSMAARMHLIPRYRQKAVMPPLFAGHPTWEDDPNFSLDRHLRVIEAPPGTNDRQLRAIACEIFAPMLPRDRPLWDITLVHGLEGDRTAFVSRVHHCLVDGVSGIELLLATLDLTPNPEPTPPPKEPWRPQPVPDPLTAWADAMFEQANKNVQAFTQWQNNLLDPRGQMRSMTDFTRAMQSVLPNLRPPAHTPWNKPIGGRRDVAWTHMSFQEVRGIRGKLGGTVNDVMLTIIGGALGRYLDAHGVKTDGMRIRLMIPVNVRSDSEKGALGNRVSMMLPNIPVGIADPVDRLEAVRGEMETLKARNQADAFESLRRLSENLPAAYHVLAGMGGVPSGGANLVCTNVPGPMIPLYSVGHRMLAHYPLVPLAGDMGIGVGITSFDKALYLGVMCDPNIVEDIDLMGGFCADEFRRLREAADVPVDDLPQIGTRQKRNGASQNGAHVDAPAAEPVEASSTAG
ncbi:MAG: wax ester/triacylglycerol synthase family O-acyltransferase [Chloroflexi bacterium]|nr:wax ester/triacylglycerol synthase family O-acyltransferase [Chloroflexota bacterium]